MSVSVSELLAAYATPLRRFIVATTTGLWLGGFTFYSAVVIHVGAELLGDHRPVGFITQEVTHWLNMAGGVALASLLWNLLATAQGQPRLRRWTVWATWGTMAAALAALVGLHVMIDGYLDRDSQTILDYHKFLWLHRAYLAIATAQWSAGLLHVWCLLLPRRDNTSPKR